LDYGITSVRKERVADQWHVKVLKLLRKLLQPVSVSVPQKNARRKRKLKQKGKGDNMPGYHTNKGMTYGNKSVKKTMKRKKPKLKKRIRKMRKNKAIPRQAVSQKSYGGNPNG